MDGKILSKNMNTMNISIVKIMKVIYALALSCFVLTFGSCNEEPTGRQPVDSDAPDAVSEVTWYPTPGGAVFHYTLPDNEDLLYVKAIFSRDEGTESESIASIYADSLVIEGFGDTLKKEVSLYAVDRSGNLSLPVVVRDIIPLRPTIYSIADSLQLVTDFGGIRAKWTNESGEEFAIVVLRKDSINNEYVPFERTFSTVRNGNFSIGNNAMKPVTGDYAVYAQDRWGHITETKYYTLTPLFINEFDKSLFRGTPLPNDCVIMSGYPITRLWDGVRSGSSIVAVQSGDMIMPKAITFDMGVPGNIYRIQVLWRIDPGWEWRGGSAKVMKLYACAELDPTGNWDSWTEIYHYVSVKPSGLPYGQETAEDLEIYNAGELFDIDISLPKMRYIRINVYETWGQNDAYQISEITIFGDNR
jgi:hypothetical protein